ncbi:MAG: hypothetical protein LLF94_11960 [Chlamydiales bacterium]|nr:hypothetical protein [Chlamydiales bacterium]
MYGASNSLTDNTSKPEIQTRSQKYRAFLALLERAKHYSKQLTSIEMHNLASLIPDWMHHLSYQQIELTLEHFTHGSFIPFLQKGYKEAFGELCRQAYLHGKLYHVLQDVTIDDKTAQVIKAEVKAEVLESNRPCFFSRIFGVRSIMAVQLDREPACKNTSVVDAIVAEAVVEAACNKMSHPEADLNACHEIHDLATNAIKHQIEQASNAERITFSIPQPKPCTKGNDRKLHFVYDMAAFIVSNEK